MPDPPIRLTDRPCSTTQGQVAAFRLHYLPALDGLRGVAVILVMAHHLGLPMSRGGWLGVDIFFVLSGFLITAILVQEWDETGGIDFGRFYARRALRLLPALCVLLLVLASIALLISNGPEAAAIWQAIPFTVMYAQNWAIGLGWIDSGVLGHTWSLAIEEQFYFLWPPVLALCLRKGMQRWRLIGLVLGGLLLSGVLRAVLWHIGSRVSRVQFGSDTRADALLCGCVLGLLATGNRLPGASRMLSIAATIAAAGLGAMSVLSRNYSGYLYEGVLTLIAVGSAVVIAEIIGAPGSRLARILTGPALVWMGRLSYGFYLWHWPVFYATIRLFGVKEHIPLATHLVIAIVQLGATFVIVPMSYYGVEQPFLQLKHRLRSDQPAVPFGVAGLSRTHRALPGDKVDPSP
jgi:peptidoglycan/LPS O-acetylase OafA/YrhL